MYKKLSSNRCELFANLGYVYLIDPNDYNIEDLSTLINQKIIIDERISTVIGIYSYDTLSWYIRDKKKFGATNWIGINVRF